MSGLEVELKNYKVIAEANVALPGITVLAGPNGSGKTTFAKFLYHFIDTNLNFENSVNTPLMKLIQEVARVLTRALDSSKSQNELFADEKSRQLTDAIVRIESIAAKGGQGLLMQEGVSQYFSHFATAFDTILRNEEQLNISTSVLNGLLRTLPTNAIEEITKLMTIKPEIATEENFHTLKRAVLSRVLEYLRELNEKRNRILRRRYLSEFEQQFFKALSIKMSAIQYGVKLDNISLLNDESFESLVGIFDQVIYLESYILPVDIEQNKDQINFLDKLLTRKNDKFIPNDDEIDEAFTSQPVLHGHINMDEFGVIRYHTDYGNFPIDECASGVKMLAILYMLYKNGHLNRYTVVIIEEPEAHLHPQWIVEYARLLILLQQKLAVTFLITSHSPTLVRSMKYISEKILKQPERIIRFYLGEPSTTALGKFNIVDKGFKMNDIIGSFNLALDRVNEYADRDD